MSLVNRPVGTGGLPKLAEVVRQLDERACEFAADAAGAVDGERAPDADSLVDALNGFDALISPPQGVEIDREVVQAAGQLVAVVCGLL